MEFKQEAEKYWEEELESLPNYGDHMTLEQFKSACDCGLFIDYDGFGCFATETKMTKQEIWPSKFLAGDFEIDDNITHIVWFNK